MIYEKRGQWCWRDSNGKLHKFKTEEEAKIAAGWIAPVEENLYGCEEEEEEGYEEASTYKQSIVFGSEKPSKKKV